MYGLAGLGGKMPSHTAKDSTMKPATLMRPPVLRKPAPPAKPGPKLAPPPPPTFAAPEPKKQKTEEVATSSSVNVHQSSKAIISELMLPDAYNPFMPNDYESFCNQRAMRAREEEMRREAEANAMQRQRINAARNMPSWMASKTQDSGENPATPTPTSPTPTAPVPETGDEAYKRRMMMSQSQPSTGDEAYQRRLAMSQGAGGGGGMGMSAPPGPVKGRGAAANMMAKMGWKGHGHGLGRKEQGIANPLASVAAGGGMGAGVVLDEPPPPGPSPKKSVRRFVGTPSRVILLKNMVGPGEVDDELQGEISEECSKYGAIDKVLIFEAIGPRVAPEEAVRIFVAFKGTDAARKAYIDLDGRFFGGRTVNCSFFQEERFQKHDLAPGPLDPR